MCTRHRQRCSTCRWGGGATACATGTAPAGGSGAAPTTAAATKPNAAALKVGVAYDIGGRGDESFNDSAYAGIEKAIADLGLPQANVKELTAGPERAEDAAATRLRQLAADGFNPVIAVGFEYAGPLAKVAAELPNTKFAIVDDNSMDGAATSPRSCSPRSRARSWSASAAALKSKAGKIGFVGGVEVDADPEVRGRLRGRARRRSKPDIKIEGKYITPAGDFTGSRTRPRARRSPTAARRRRRRRLPRRRRVRARRVPRSAKAADGSRSPSASTPTSTSRPTPACSEVHPHARCSSGSTWPCTTPSARSSTGDLTSGCRRSSTSRPTASATPPRAARSTTSQAKIDDYKQQIIDGDDQGAGQALGPVRVP